MEKKKSVCTNVVGKKLQSLQVICTDGRTRSNNLVVVPKNDILLSDKIGWRRLPWKMVLREKKEVKSIDKKK